MWIILLEVHYCTVEQVSHFYHKKARASGKNRRKYHKKNTQRILIA